MKKLTEINVGLELHIFKIEGKWVPRTKNERRLGKCTMISSLGFISYFMWKKYIIKVRRRGSKNVAYSKVYESVPPT